MKLALPPALRVRIVAEARAAFPRECCGLIQGTREAGLAYATALHPARNIATARARFEIHPEDHFAALKSARAGGHILIGCYHSHPGGKPEPSEADRAGAGEEDFFWLIAALDAAEGAVEVAGFAYRGAGFVPTILSGADGADLVTSSAKLRS